MPDQGLIDERIKRELRSIEGEYDEADWKLLEPFVDTLQPPSAFKLNKKAGLILILCFALGIGLYFAIPYFKKMQEIPVDNTSQDSSLSDTTSSDPTFRPDTIVSRPQQTTPAPVPAPIDSTVLKAREDSIRAASEKPEPVKTEPSKEVRRPTDTQPRKKRREQPKVEQPADEQKHQEDSEELFRKDVPIIAVPEEQPAPDKTPPEKKEEGLPQQFQNP